MTRMNISLPVELKERMDAVEVRVNWSQVACAAFEHKLIDVAEIEEQRAEAKADPRWRVELNELTAQEEVLKIQRLAEIKETLGLPGDAALYEILQAVRKLKGLEQ